MADTYSVELMSRISAHPKALAAIVQRVAGDLPLLNAGEWAALQRLCGG